MSIYKRIKVIVFAQQKGGVGKTTLSRNYAQYLAMYREARVLLVDFDPQCNLSMRFLAMEKPGSDWRIPPVHPDFDSSEAYEDGWNGRSSSVDIFNGVAPVPYPTDVDHLAILPGHGGIMDEVEAQSRGSRDLFERVVNRLREFIEDPDVQDQYDVVVVDTGPNRLTLTRAAIRAATHLVIPLECEKMNTETLSDMLDLWREENSTRAASEAIDLVGIVPNLIKRTSLHNGVLESLRNDPGLGELIVPFVLHDRTAVAEADHEASRHHSVFELPEADPARVEASVMCQYVENAMFGNVRG